MSAKDCIYCDSKAEGTHFLCDLCGKGMCEECYESDKEHDSHINMFCDDYFIENEISSKKPCERAIEICGCEPDYLCNSCISKLYNVKEVGEIFRVHFDYMDKEEYREEIIKSILWDKEQGDYIYSNEEVKSVNEALDSDTWTYADSEWKCSFLFCL